MKMKLFCFGAFCACAAAAVAATDKSAAGMLYTPPKGPQVLVWDARTNATDRVLRRFLNGNDPAKVTGPGLAVVTDRTPLVGGDAYEEAIKRLGPDVALVVALVDGGAKTPRLSVYPEERVALVNADRCPRMLLDKLLVREIWRAIGFAGGCGYAPYRGCVMQPVFTDTEILGLPGDVLQPMTLQGFRKFETRCGMKRMRYVPYEYACYEGWAPQPTNETQKTIWREVKEELAREPSKPIQIRK